MPSVAGASPHAFGREPGGAEPSDRPHADRWPPGSESPAGIVIAGAAGQTGRPPPAAGSSIILDTGASDVERWDLRSLLLTLRSAQDVVAADAPPDDVRARTSAVSVLEGGSAVWRPGHLEDIIGALDSLDPQSRPEAVTLEVLDEAPNCVPETLLVVSAKPQPIAIEAGRALPGRHSVERLEELVVGLVAGRATGRDVF